MTHVAFEHPDDPGRFLVCRVALGGQLTAVEDCPLMRIASLRCAAHDRGGRALDVDLPFERPRRLVKGFYTNEDAGG